MEHGHGSVCVGFGPPCYPAADKVAGGYGLLFQGRRFPKSSKFTRSLLRHGPWANNTLDEATNLRERERRLRERTMQKIEKMSHKFRWEVQEIERIQSAVRARQHRIAQANLRSCCAMMIQTTFRGYRARALARERRGRRLGEMLIGWWRSFKARQSLAIVTRFIKCCVQRRRESARTRLAASITVQRAWRRWMFRLNLGRVVLATAAIETILEDLLVDLARRIYLEIKGAVIVKAWKKSKRRLRIAAHKNRNRRSFVTQGGVSSPRRKGNTPRILGTRNGISSDPSSSFNNSRRSPSNAPGNRGGGGKGKTSAPVGSPTPAFLSVVAAVTAVSTSSAEAAAATPAQSDGGDGGGGGSDDCRGSSHDRYTPSLSSSSQKITPEQNTSSLRFRREDSITSTIAASTGKQAVASGTGGGSKASELSPSSRSPCGRISGGEGPTRSETSCSSDGCGQVGFMGGKIECAVGGVMKSCAGDEKPIVSEGTGVPAEASPAAGNTGAAVMGLSNISREKSLRPRRPSDQRPSKLSEGRGPSRTNALLSKARSSVSGVLAGEYDQAKVPSGEAGASSRHSARRSFCCEPASDGETGGAASSLMPASAAPAELSMKAKPTTASQKSCTKEDFEAISYRGEGNDDGDDDDDDDDDDDGNDGDIDKLSALVGRNEPDELLRKLDGEEYNSDAFESDGEISLTR